jgi:hypothetical protein
MGEEPKPAAGKAGVEVSFVQITAAGGNVIELFGLTRDGKVFRYHFGYGASAEKWTPLSMVKPHEK